MLSRCAAWIAVAAAVAQAAGDPAAEAYLAVKQKDYEKAAIFFRLALAGEPKRVELRKELAYVLLKMGDTVEARDEFAEVMRLAPQDWHSALEYGYLCHETSKIGEARRVFDRVRTNGDAESRKAAEQAFLNADQPLVEAVRRWRLAVAQNPMDFSAHVELARAAEARNDIRVAAEHYKLAWELRPAERALLVDLGRARSVGGNPVGAQAAWLAASRGSNARAAEQAREFLPVRYPYASEFQHAIELDRSNLELRRELAFLWLAINKPTEAEAEFARLLEMAPEDLTSLAQVGMLRLARGDIAGAMPLMEKVLAGKDETLAKKMRDALTAKGLKPRAAIERLSNKEMGGRSYAAGYMADAARYYRAAHAEDPHDQEVNLQLGRTYNMLRQDDEAIRYFDMARRAPDAKLKAEAQQAFHNLRPEAGRFRTTAWILPVFSSRWHEGFSYGQLKTEMRIGKLPFRPYLSLRFVGDSQRAAGSLHPQYLSESSFIAGVGIGSRPWKGLMAWAEAGNAMRYRQRADVGRMIPDYRGGISFARGFGHGIGAAKPGAFFEMTGDVVTLSRFRWDTLAYSQNRFGYTLPRAGPLQWQASWNANLTVDRNREAWANFFDSGPGLRFRFKRMPPSMLWTVDLLRGRYLTKEGTYYDVRAGVWYAISR
ncbi:MAG TPA: tetratricopeptide repeat protein [Bryobacteraceae bacterium]|nr:tetratricopeptide repeat protein [Bryobacteraceae bacterium]